MWRTKSSSHMRFYADPKAWDSEDKAFRHGSESCPFFLLLWPISLFLESVKPVCVTCGYKLGVMPHPPL